MEHQLSAVVNFLRQRHSRLRHGAERGTSLVEVVVAMTIMVICGGIFTGAVVTLYSVTNRAQAVTNSATQTNQAYQALDKLVRYAAAVTNPGFGAGVGTAKYWYVELRDTTSGSEVCTQLRLNTSNEQLQRRTWDASSQTTLTPWVQISSGITNGAAAVGSTRTALPPRGPGADGEPPAAEVHDGLDVRAALVPGEVDDVRRDHRPEQHDPRSHGVHLPAGGSPMTVSPAPRPGRVPRDDAGSMALYLMLAIMGLALAALMVPMIITQSHTTRSDTSRLHALDAAQSGVNVMLGELRAAQIEGVGTSALLPCDSASGVVNGVGSASYTVSIDYYMADPVTLPDTTKMRCLDGYGTYDEVTDNFTPKFARIVSVGRDGPSGKGKTQWAAPWPPPMCSRRPTRTSPGGGSASTRPRAPHRSSAWTRARRPRAPGRSSPSRRVLLPCRRSSGHRVPQRPHAPAALLHHRDISAGVVPGDSRNSGTVRRPGGLRGP